MLVSYPVEECGHLGVSWWSHATAIPVPPRSSISAAVAPIVPGIGPSSIVRPVSTRPRRSPELERDALADAPARAGHDRDLAVQVLIHPDIFPWDHEGMCFSAEADFVSGVVVGGVGIATLARRRTGTSSRSPCCHSRSRSTRSPRASCG